MERWWELQAGCRCNIPDLRDMTLGRNERGGVVTWRTLVGSQTPLNERAHSNYDSKQKDDY